MKNFIHRLSWSVSSHSIHPWNACRSPKSQKTLFWGFKVIDVDISKKLVASARYDKQHVCAYLQPFSRWKSQ